MIGRDDTQKSMLGLTNPATLIIYFRTFLASGFTSWVYVQHHIETRQTEHDPVRPERRALKHRVRIHESDEAHTALREDRGVRDRSLAHPAK